MATEIKLPRLGQGMESGTIVKWLKSEGDAVKKGEPLYELDTDKVTQEVEADATGVLLKIAVQEGEVPVGQTVAVIGEQGEEVAIEVAPEEPQTEGSRAPARDAGAGAGERGVRAGGTAAVRQRRDALRRSHQGFAAGAPDRARARRRPRAAARHRSRRSDRRRGRGAGGGVACACRRSGGTCGRGRDRSAHVDPQDDRAPADRGVDGAGVPADHRRRHDPRGRTS